MKKYITQLFVVTILFTACISNSNNTNINKTKTDVATEKHKDGGTYSVEVKNGATTIAKYSGTNEEFSNFPTGTIKIQFSSSTDPKVEGHFLDLNTNDINAVGEYSFSQWGDKPNTATVSFAEAVDGHYTGKMWKATNGKFKITELTNNNLSGSIITDCENNSKESVSLIATFSNLKSK